MNALASLLSPGPRSGTEATFDPSLADAREALAFWSARRSRLPWFRRAARAEARTMVWRWRARLVRAYLEHWQLGFLASRLAPLLTTAEHGNAAHAGRPGAFVLRVARRARMLLFAAAVTVLAAVALLVVVAGQLI